MDTWGEEADRIPEDCDYILSSDPKVVNFALNENMFLGEEILKLRKQNEKLSMKQQFGIHRFADLDTLVVFNKLWPAGSD